jgi:hypothetical protein
MPFFSIERIFAIYRILRVKQCDMSFYFHLRYIGLKVAIKLVQLKEEACFRMDMLSSQDKGVKSAGTACGGYL